MELKRKVLVLGRTMLDNVQIAQDLGFLKVPANVLLNPAEAEQIKPERLLLILTGSQGEPLSAAARLASGEHRFVTVQEDDLFIFSARPIPGNEVAIFGVIDDLFRMGAEVIYGMDSGVHVSGHGYQDEIREYIQTVQPRFMIPNHGEYRHQMRFKKLADQWGIPSSDVTTAQIGEVWGVSEGGLRLEDEVKAGEVLHRRRRCDGLEPPRAQRTRRIGRGRACWSSASCSARTAARSSARRRSSARASCLRPKRRSCSRSIERAVTESILRNRQRAPQFQLQLRNNVQNVIQHIIFEKTRINPVVIGMVSYTGLNGATETAG